MKDRIRKIIESQHMTQQEFAENIKVAPATLSSIFTGRTAPSLKIVEAIKNRFPDISTDWLMFGRGAMTDYRTREAGVSFGQSVAAGGQPVLDFDTAAVGVADTPTANSEAGTVAGDNLTSAASLRSVGGDALMPDVLKAGHSIKNGAVQLVKKCDTNERSIVEIRIFYSDQTWETFVPKK